MAVPARTSINQRVTSLHGALIEAGCEGHLYSRISLDSLICKKWGLSAASSKKYLEAGIMLGLWESTDPRSVGPRSSAIFKQGCYVILAKPEA